MKRNWLREDCDIKINEENILENPFDDTAVAFAYQFVRQS